MSESTKTNLVGWSLVIALGILCKYALAFFFL